MIDVEFSKKNGVIIKKNKLFTLYLNPKTQITKISRYDYFFAKKEDYF